MLMPKRTKYRKTQKGRMAGKAKGGTRVSFGEYGLQAMEPGWITARQIEAARIAMTRKIKRGGKVWITIFPDKPISKKPLETRMGKGKADTDFWAARVKPGTILYEIAGVPVTRVGRVTAGDGLRCLLQGEPVGYSHAGYRHFA